MLSEEVRRRLAQLNRQSLPVFEPAKAQTPWLRGLEPSAAWSGELVAPRLDAPPPGGEEQHNASGRHWRLRRPLTEFWPNAACTPLVPAPLDWALGQSDFGHPELAAVANSFPRAAMFLDLETCGFAGSMVFLIGLICSDGQQLVLDQLLARDYAEERAILETLWEIARGHEVLVTFNGKSFDWPMVVDRTTLHRLDQRAAAGGSDAPPELGRHVTLPQLVHCDLLHHARRKWKRRLPNCRLQTLERWICRRSRSADLGGAQIPLAYHEFVRSGNWAQLNRVLHHNALDLVTLVEVMLGLLNCGPSSMTFFRERAGGRSMPVAEMPPGQ